jgi:hypothetical protein
MAERRYTARQSEREERPREGGIWVLSSLGMVFGKEIASIRRDGASQSGTWFAVE